MDVQQKIEHYKDVFNTDPLFRELKHAGLTNELFKNHTYFEIILFEKSYSSKHAAEFLEIPDKEHTLINYINRNDLNAYLDVARKTRFYRYDWKSLFKFKMILLLNENGFTPLEIADIVGTRIEVSSTIPYESFKLSSTSNDNDEILNHIKNFTIHQSNELKKSIQTLEEFRNKKSEHLISKIKIEQNIVFKNEEHDLLNDRINDMECYLKLFETTYNLNKKKKKNESLFSKLFSNGNINQEQNDSDFKEQIANIAKKKKTLIDKRDAIIETDIPELILELEEENSNIENVSNHTLEEIEKLSIQPKGGDANEHIKNITF